MELVTIILSLVSMVVSLLAHQKSKAASPPPPCKIHDEGAVYTARRLAEVAKKDQ